MSRLLKQEWLQILIIIAPLVLIVALWSQIPEQIAVHWSLSCKANRYGSKETEIFIVPLINILIVFLLRRLQFFDPKAAMLNFSASTMKTVCLLVSGFLSLISIGMVLNGAGYNFNMGDASQYGTVAFFLILGNFLPKIRANYFIGIRTPWTLEDPDNWSRTHKFAGKLWVIASIVALLLMPLLPPSAAEKVFVSFLAVIVIPPLVYSFMVFRASRRAAAQR